MKKWLIALVVVALSAVPFVLLNRSAKADSSTSMRVYDISGNEQMSSHIVIGTAALSVGTKTITLTNGAVFTSSSSYRCSVTDSTGLNLTSISYASGSSFTITGTLTDNVSFVCIGD
jgi:hypothetical protein